MASSVKKDAGRAATGCKKGRRNPQLPPGVAAALKRRLVFRRWRLDMDLKQWRSAAMAALARCASPGPSARTEDVDISVDDICVPTSFEIVESMVGARLKEEGVAPGTVQGDHPVRKFRRRRSADIDDLEPAKGATGSRAARGGSSSSTAWPRKETLSHAALDADRAALKTIDEVEAEVREMAPTETAACLRRWGSQPVNLAHRSARFTQYTDCTVGDPHRWWTERLAPKRRGADAAVRRHLAKKGEVVLTVAVCSSAGHKEQEFDVLASQPMFELRDAFYFASDWMYDGPTRIKSGLFFIDGIFYSDRRDPAALDYSRELIGWLRRTKEPGFLRSDTSRSMATCFADLDRIPFGERCVYVHQGDIEHSVYFTNARLLRSACDCPYREAYPILTFMRRYNKRLCYACIQNYAMWIVIDSSRCPHNPSYWCQTCFRHFFQDAEGNYLPPVDYKVFPYLHDET